MIDVVDPEPDIIDLPPSSWRPFELPERTPRVDDRKWIREGLWVRVYNDDGEYQGDVDWPRVRGMLQ